MNWKKYCAHAVLTILLVACARVPVTNRAQVNLLPESTLRNMAVSSYSAFLSENNVVPMNNADAKMVQKVGEKIAKAASTYLGKKKKHKKRIENYKWEFNLVQDDAANAWCMPGGKVVFYTGILPFTKTEAGIATVMGHEIAHAIARHGNERMSQQLVVQLGGVGLAVALDEKPETTKQLFLLSYGVGAQLGVLKYSRTHESEADKMGMIFMALAGYDPAEALHFWERMKKSGGGSPPKLLSTHPPYDDRINEIKKFLPKAKRYYSKR